MTLDMMRTTLTTTRVDGALARTEAATLDGQMLTMDGAIEVGAVAMAAGVDRRTRTFLTIEAVN